MPYSLVKIAKTRSSLRVVSVALAKTGSSLRVRQLARRGRNEAAVFAPEKSDGGTWLRCAIVFGGLTALSTGLLLVIAVAASNRRHGATNREFEESKEENDLFDDLPLSITRFLSVYSIVKASLKEAPIDPSVFIYSPGQMSYFSAPFLSLDYVVSFTRIKPIGIELSVSCERIAKLAFYKQRSLFYMCSNNSCFIRRMCPLE